MSSRHKNTGVATNTIITRSSLSKGNNKYSLSKEEKKEAKRSNKLRKKRLNVMDVYTINDLAFVWLYLKKYLIQL